MLTNIKETGSHYTSTKLSEYMAGKLLHYADVNSKGGQVILDPACGEGELLKAVQQKVNESNNISLIGIDTNANAIQQAHHYLDTKNNENVELYKKDYLNLNIFEEDINLFSDFNNDENYLSEKKVDLIIANPPYVRTQVLGAERAQELGERFSLKGRVDLYQVFLVAMTKHLKEGGIICVITSNRYLTTEGGKDIRNFLNSNYEMLEIIDLGDTKLFDAAVLPAIFIGRKKKKNISNDKVKFLRIYENNSMIKNNSVENCSSIYEVLNKKKSGIFEVEDRCYEVTSGILKIPEDPKEIWVMATEEENKWSELVKKNSRYIFNDIFNVKVGIKTTADKVFIRDDWNQLPEYLQPESEVLKSLVTSKNAEKWNVNHLKTQLKVLYTHENIKGKRQAINLEKYPKAKVYLESHKDILASRKYVIKAKRKWYEIWVPQDPDAWDLPKIVFPDISSTPKFAIDLEGHIVDGNCYWITLKDMKKLDLLYLAVVVANSNVMNKFHEIEFQNRLYAGRKRYVTQYIKNYPLPDPESKPSKKLIQIGKLLTKGNLTEDEIKLYEEKVELYVKEAFKL